MKRTALLAGVLMLGGVLGAAGPSAAQSYAKRPVTLVMPFPPGGGTDTVARVLVAGMSDVLGQPVVIENRPGAAGTTGMLQVARAQPDGQVVVITNNPPLTMNMFLQKNFPYDSIDAFAPISLIAETVILLAVHRSLPIQSVADLVDYAKKNPGKLSYGTPGVGTAMHVAGESMKLAAGFDMVHVPYRGTAVMLQDLVAGTIQVGLGTPTALVPFAEQGSIRILALVEEKRSPEFPGVPTISETIPGVVTNTWTGLFAPAGTPKDIVQQLHHALVKTLKTPDIDANIRRQGWYPVGGSPDELRSLIKDERARWGKAITSIGLKPE